ncbi:unnamed protein product [Ectocarpus sp. CCAP 1310/34]|nr:unnamed protein product [Ectocarpus sp. CCAP 1310/34]
MLLPAPAADVVRLALQRRNGSDCLRILVMLACLACCRRGRAALSLTVCKVTSPVSFLLCCIGLSRRRDRNNGTLLCGNGNGDTNAGQRPRGRIGGWTSAFRRGIPSCESGEGGDLFDQQGGGALASRSALSEATLGARGRRTAFERFGELRRVGACCDVTLAVGSKHFKAHKCVLAAQSSPLRAMFEGSFKEGSEDVISLLDVEPHSFSLLLDFFYDRGVEVTDENVEALLDLSARYGVSLLRRHCCAFLAGSASPATACSLLSVADRYDCHRLRRVMLAYTLERFPTICRDSSSDGFRHLSAALVVEVLKDDRLAAGQEGELAVFWAAISWLEAEHSRRRNADEANIVLSHVRFGLVSAKAIADAVEAHPLMQSAAGKAFVHEAYRYQALPPESRDNFASSMAARARRRTAAGGDGGRGYRTGQSPSAALKPDHGDGVGDFSGWLRVDGFGDDQGDSSSDSSSCEVRGSGAGDSESEGGEDPPVAGGESSRHGGSNGGAAADGGIGDGMRSAPVSGSAEEMSAGREESARGESRVGNESRPRKLHMTDGNPKRRLWGAGTRMYV